MYHRKELLPEIVEISSQTHLQLEQKCLAALVVQLNVSLRARVVQALAFVLSCVRSIFTFHRG